MSLSIPRLIGHRGAARHAPENTLSGMRVGALQGALWVEVDVKITRDGVPILMHDDDLDRTTTGHGPVAAMDFADIRRLDAGSWFAAEFRGEPVPTLAEAIQAAQLLDINLNLEIKPCPGREEQTAGIALSMALNLWPTDRPPPLISSFSIEALSMAKVVAPQWPRGFLMDEEPADWADIADRLQAATINIDAKKQTAESIQAFRATGRPILAYTVNDADQARQLFQWGVAGLFTDTPKGLYEGLIGKGSGGAGRAAMVTTEPDPPA
ncbi:glycerophosphodiester phosphodiesterase [Niveispirillum lacus]|uniref:Glycerophosphodiester phosphodiesterase n=1 Tax=Niveispirillum lacus TaxID=1981099 RepID=A0A255Z381_9PROT|nr:glycerophosphodiester phosphodiesterase [Niveispirillum lacus]OYQ35899.1 glycerophosphodiester phosphodiesterase [Niveispirillum lacus]